jgi:xylan 1,4-beta-xylosidase
MQTPLDVRIDVHADRRTGPYRANWNWVGYDEPNYTYTPDGKKLLRHLAELTDGPMYIRAHNLLTSGDGTAALKWGSTNAYTEDADGNPVYDWTIMDRIFDTYDEAGVIPFVQIGFTPEALSSASEGPYQHSWKPNDRTMGITAGWAAPPKDLKKWGALIEAWAQHLADRYGRERVSTWPWEVWNEPDGLYWTGTIPEFCEMYDVSARAVKKVLPDARVGGPHVCGGFGREAPQTFMREFLRFVVDRQSPIDFIAFHAKGNPVVWKDHVRMGIHKHMRDIDTHLNIINEFPQLRHLPIVIGESDPEGCAACSARWHPQNAYRNGPLYGAYLVESMIRTEQLANRADLTIEGAVTWAFMFDGQPWFDGFRDLATNGIDKAVLNAMRMLGKLGGERVESSSSHAAKLEDILEHGVREAPDVDAIATRDDGGLSILVWHYHDDDLAGDAAEITIDIGGWQGEAPRLRHFRMDEDHSNAYAVWKKLGSPQDVSEKDFNTLETASRLAELDADETAVAASGDGLKLTFTLPRQGVSLLRLER